MAFHVKVLIPSEAGIQCPASNSVLNESIFDLFVTPFILRQEQHERSI